tara:strand:+ start:463 stop:810 length:348 start_codon:yes stop_codon:yes gene_type:complete
MITIYVSYGNEQTEKWINIHSAALVPSSELYPDSRVCDESFGINDSEFSLPNGETFKVSATFTPSNMGIMIVVTSGNNTLINVACYKQSLENHDPSILFRTPKGLDVTIMAGQNS